MEDEEETWNKWRNWLEVIEEEILDLHHHHQIWRTLVDRIAEQNLPESEYFVDAFTRMYIAGQAMGLRRQADTGRGTVSLARLLVGLINQSRVVTRVRFFALWGLVEGPCNTSERDQLEHRARIKRAVRAWSKFASPMDDVLDPAIPGADLKRLQSTASQIVAYADKTIAHRDVRGPSSLPRFLELHGAIEELGRLYCRYSLLLTASAPSPAALTPVMQADWLAPFRRPLF